MAGEPRRLIGLKLALDALGVPGRLGEMGRLLQGETVPETGEDPEDRLYLWQQDGFTLTSLASSEAEHGTPPDLDETEERPRNVRMLVGNRRLSTSIRNIGASLMTASPTRATTRSGSTR